MKVSQRVSESQTQTVGSTLGWSQFTKGHNSTKTVDGVIILNSIHRLVMFDICTRFQENISKGFRIKCNLYTEICQMGIILQKNVDGVMVLVLSALSDNAFYLY